MEPVRQLRADAGNRGEERRRVAFPAQPLEHRETPAHDEIADGARQNRADPGQTVEPFDSLGFEDPRNRPVQTAQSQRGFPVGLHAKRIRSLRVEQLRHLLEPRADPGVEVEPVRLLLPRRVSPTD